MTPVTRKLASIVSILSVEPVPNADRLEKIGSLGYQVVSEKGRWSVGDMAVYFEADSVLPDIDALRWVWTPKDTPPDVKVPRPADQRLRAVRLRGCLSMGILLKLPELGLDPKDFKTGDDVTSLLGVTQFEEDSSDEAFRAPFPSFVSRTSEMRAQSLPDVLKELAGKAWVATLKIDGQSLTAYLDAGDLHVTGRKHSILESDVPHWRVARKYKLQDVLRENPHLVIQGEVAGPGILGNKLELKEHDFFVYNIHHKQEDRLFLDAEMREFCADHGLKAVPKVAEGVEFSKTMDELQELSAGKYEGTNRNREGIVVRPRDELIRSDTVGKWLSFKMINNSSLVK